MEVTFSNKFTGIPFFSMKIFCENFVIFEDWNSASVLYSVNPFQPLRLIFLEMHIQPVNMCISKNWSTKKYEPQGAQGLERVH